MCNTQCKEQIKKNSRNNSVKDGLTNDNDHNENHDMMFIADDECASKLTEGDQQTITALYIHDANLLLGDTVNTPLHTCTQQTMCYT